ncbi:GDSL-type esterase/lipase family protein [Paenibacillus terrigena]|uniref:GDSL-type esterase/lipase family protein n=1 Tax=Paenibacillus terrigena TaxID=369333 RepID=UPI00036681F5|nr:GDSL-type esterase/lipase family protein [Paenibacillus terrigena]
MKSNRIWRLTAITGVVSTLLLMVGFGYGVNDILNPRGVTMTDEVAPKPQTPTTSDLSQKSTIQVTSIGDSLTRGTGDSTGNGYVRNVIKMLGDKWNKPVKLLNNLGINGLRADELVHKLQEKGFKNAIMESDLILLTIGGNDLFSGAVEGDFSSESFELDKMLEKVDDSAKDLKTILLQISELNPNARIVYVGLYNPLADMKDMRQIGNTVVQRWNNLAYATINKHPNMTLVPTADLFQSTLSQVISSDHFHPNALGYEQIATRIVQGIAP